VTAIGTVALRDDELARELRGTLQGNRPTRAEEWRDPEPPAEDDRPPEPGDLSHSRNQDSSTDQ
jgi:hypothetical protein